MSELFKKREAPKAEAPVALAVFTPSGDTRPDGSVRYKVLCDGGISPSGVYWSKTVPAGATIADYKAAEAERDEAIERLKGLTVPA